MESRFSQSNLLCQLHILDLAEEQYLSERHKSTIALTQGITRLKQFTDS